MNKSYLSDLMDKKRVDLINKRNKIIGSWWRKIFFRQTLSIIELQIHVIDLSQNILKKEIEEEKK